MDLATLWFFIVAFFFVGYFVLDGFDFGVGMSLPFLGKDDVSRRQVINTIGPVWDLNETWVIVAGAVLFASFPEWYATLFSGFYLPLLLILLALILRGVSFEYRHQRDSGGGAVPGRRSRLQPQHRQPLALQRWDGPPSCGGFHNRAVLRRLQSRPPVDRRTALHLPLCHAGPRPAQPAAGS